MGKEKAENVAELFRQTENTDADKSKLKEEILSLREIMDDKDKELSQKQEKLEALSKAFEIFQHHADCVDSSPAGDVGSTSKTYAWPSEPEQGKRVNQTTKQKLAYMEKFVFQISELVENLIEKRNNAEAEKTKLQRTHDKLIQSFQKLDDALRRQEKQNSGGGGGGEVFSSQPTMTYMRTTTMARRASMMRRGSVAAPRKSIIVKSLRGGLNFEHKAED